MRRLLAPVALVAALALTLAACGSSAPGPPPASQGLVLNRPTPQHVTLESQAGQAVSLADLRGRIVVLAPFLSLCQDECPLITAAFISLQRDVLAGGFGHKVVFLEVSVDPGRDSAPRLAAYQREFGASWELWTGSAQAIAAFWKAFGVTYQIVPEDQPPHLDWWTGKPLTYDVTHTDGYILLDQHGRERFVDASAPALPHLAPKLAKLLNAGGLNGLHHPQADDWSVTDALNAIGWLLGSGLPSVSTP